MRPSFRPLVAVFGHLAQSQIIAGQVASHVAVYNPSSIELIVQLKYPPLHGKIVHNCLRQSLEQLLPIVNVKLTDWHGNFSRLENALGA